MTGFVVDIELSLTLEELTRFKRLAELEGTDVPTMARHCMNSKSKELLGEKQQTDTKKVAKANKRTKTRNVIDPSIKSRSISKDAKK